MAAPQGVRSAGYRPQNMGNAGAAMAGGSAGDFAQLLAQFSGKPPKGLDYGETFRDRIERRRSEFGRDTQENGRYGSKPGEGRGLSGIREGNYGNVQSALSALRGSLLSSPAGRAQAASPAPGAAFGGTPGFGASAPAGGNSVSAPGGGQQQGYSFGGGPSVASTQPYSYGGQPGFGQSVGAQGPTVQAPASQMTQPFQYGAQPHQMQATQPFNMGGGGGRMGAAGPFGRDLLGLTMPMVR